jgi:hypothetical protein
MKKYIKFNNVYINKDYIVRVRADIDKQISITTLTGSTETEYFIDETAEGGYPAEVNKEIRMDDLAHELFY